ncbi:MAG TPA: hypothetical protein VGS21_05685, partial [Acidimicrobiales bacterium]|nr:hypothetical protein [Acidimicrobiales bacterium]
MPALAGRILEDGEMGIITGRLQPGRPAHVARATAAVVALGLSLAACSATLTSGSTTNPGLGGFGLPTTTGGSGCNNPYGEPTGPPIAKVRVANLLLLNGQPAPSYDFYDTSHPTSCDKPLISGLAYGQVSSYVSPRAEGPEQDFTSGDYANLFIFAAGSKTYGQTLPGGDKSGSNITNSGWVQGDQETVVLSPNVFNQEVENSMGSSLMLEATTQHLLAVAAPPSGDGQLVVNQAGLIEGTKTLGLVEIR